MEASGAGLAAADAAPSGEQPAEQAEPTLADIRGDLKQFGSDIEQMRAHLASEPWQPPAEQEPQTPAEPDPMDFSFLDENQPSYQGPEQAAQQLQDLIRNEASKIAKEAIGPVQQEIRQERHDRQFSELSEKYPQLQDEKAAGELLDLTAKIVDQEGFPEEMKLHPGFIEKMYLAARAQQQNQEGGDAPAATLEGAGGASPGGAGQGAEPTDRPWGEQVAPKRLAIFAGD